MLGLDFALCSLSLNTHHVRGLLRRGDEPGCRDEEGRHACPVSVVHSAPTGCSFFLKLAPYSSWPSTNAHQRSHALSPRSCQPHHLTTSLLFLLTRPPYFALLVLFSPPPPSPLTTTTTPPASSRVTPSAAPSATRSGRRRRRRRARRRYVCRSVVHCMCVCVT